MLCYQKPFQTVKYSYCEKQKTDGVSLAKTHGIIQKGDLRPYIVGASELRVGWKKEQNNDGDDTVYIVWINVGK